MFSQRSARRSNWATTAVLSTAAALVVGAAFDALLFRRMRSTRSPTRLVCRSFTSSGKRAYFLQAGHGAVVVVIASMVVRARTYLPLVRELAKSHRVIVLEAPGCGRSSRLDRPWSVAQYGQWVNAFIEQQDLSRVTLLGHSNSGPVAMEVTRHSTRVSQLILVDSVGGRAQHGLLRVLGARAADACQEMGLNLRAWWHVAYNMLVHPKSFFHQVWFGSQACHLSTATRLPVPTVVAWGKRDLTMPLRSALRLHRAIGGSQLVVGPGSHDWLITHPRAFVQLLFERG